MSQSLVNNVHNQVVTLELGLPVQGFSERLGLAKGGEEGEMAFMIVGFDLGPRRGGLEGRHCSVVRLSE